MTKKQMKIENNKHRGSWYGVKPVTKVVKSKKIYNRKKIKYFE